MASVSLQAVSKHFGAAPAVREVSFDIAEGELVVILGASGCGKTTTLRMIAGFVEPSAGRILIGGEDVTRVPPRLRNIGMVFQSYAVWPHMTVWQNVAYPLRHRADTSRAARDRKVEEALALVGLSEFAQRSVVSLSGGQMQRVALARSLVYQPQLLLLDEPLSNLDANLRLRLRDSQRIFHGQIYIARMEADCNSGCFIPPFLLRRFWVLNRGGNGSSWSGMGGGIGGSGLQFVTTQASVASVQTLARNFISSIGVDLTSNNPANAGKVVVWNDRKGVLLVRATSQDLDLIESVMQTLNQAPPLINIRAKFIEITQNDNRGLGFNWTVGAFKVGSAAVASAGTQPTLAGAPTSVNPSGAFPLNGVGGTATPPAASDGSLTGGLRNLFGDKLSGTLPTLGTVTGILTEPQFRFAINALQQRDGTDELNATEVTTESGRQAQMQAVDIITIVTGTSTTTGTGAGTPTPAGGGTIIATAAAPAVNYPTSTFPFGPTLDVIPYLSADEYSVQMTLVPTVTEFVGYDDPGQFVPQAVAAGSGGANLSVTATLPLPHFRAREVVTSVTVWDTQTVVLGGLITDVVTKVKDQVPLLGSLPLFGRLFQSQSASKTKKNLMIFVTPTIMNPDGTRYHSDDEMPFNSAYAPVAKPVSTP